MQLRFPPRFRRSGTGSGLGVKMRLTLFTDYTLRILIYLALRPADRVTIRDIGIAYHISTNHLMKVVHQLALSGDITTVRGHHGGIRLAHPPGEINLGTVVRRSEPDLELVPCFDPRASCAIRHECVLTHVVDEALRAFLATLDRYTLADLVRPRSGLTALLGVAGPAEPPVA